MKDEWEAYLGEKDGQAPATQIALPSSQSATQWVDTEDVNWQNYCVVTEQTLSDFVVRANAEGDNCTIRTTTVGRSKTKVKYVYKAGGSSYDSVLCNGRSNSYVALAEPEKAAVNNTFNNSNVVVKQVEGDDISQTVQQIIQGDNSGTTTVYQGDIKNEDNSQSTAIEKIIDLTGATFTTVNENGIKTEQYIENLTWNEDNSSYTVNTYDIVYNTTNNYYEYNFYTYNVQYTYNNTYVTYLGSTAEYVPTVYEMYYELPDGRSSADLTEEDIAGLSFQFADCVNYKKSATDTSLRALYHFDGNTQDSSFWSGQGSFDWTTGASITYMESNAFDGALYLDEKDHQFTITLPSVIGAGDFSLQFRYYQNSAITSNTMDNRIASGAVNWLQWSENYFYDGNGAQYPAAKGVSLGSWQELAIIRSAGTRYFYHNGIVVGSAPDSIVYGDSITFSLGPASRAYSMIDELRFTNFAVVSDGTAYTPVSVPYDTNAVLVLPDGATPVADAYWEVDASVTPFYSFDASDGVSAVSRGVTGFTFKDGEGNYDTVYSCWFPDSPTPSDTFYYGSANDISVNAGSVSFGSRLPNLSNVGGFYNNYKYYVHPYNAYSGSAASFPADKIPTPYFVTAYDTVTAKGALSYFKNYWANTVNKPRGKYTFTALFADGSRATATVDLTPDTSALLTGSKSSYDYYQRVDIPLASSTATLNLTYLSILTQPNRSGGTSSTSSHTWHFCDVCFLSGPADVVYFEMVPGEDSNNFEYHSVVYASDEIAPNTAAVQSDIPVHGYTVGGVRPTFPVRGDVWFPVEGSRISGVYIYNGQAWEQTNARWWTGSRWIPIYAFDLVTLADLWDVVGTEGEPITPAITSDYSFWNWWKNEWNSFTGKLFGVLGGGSDGSGTSGGNGSGGSGTSGSSGGSGDSGRGFFQTILDGLANGLKTLIEGVFSIITNILTTILGALTDLLASLFSFVTDTVLGGISSFFSSFTDGSLFSPFEGTVNNGDGTTSSATVLPEGIAGVFTLFAGIFRVFPPEITGILIFGVAALALISVLKFVLT